MTDRDALIARLRAIGQDMGVVASVLMRTARDGNDDQKSIERLNAWRGEILAVMDALSTPPPADLVALVAKMQNAEAESEQAALRGDMAASIKAAERWDAACDDLLAYPLPAAPPVTDTPQGWQPIETAPKDGTCIHVWAAEGLSFPTVFWTNHDIEGWHVDDGKRGPFPLRGASPTHWMPLPAVPPQPTPSTSPGGGIGPFPISSRQTSPKSARPTAPSGPGSPADERPDGHLDLFTTHLYNG